MAVWETGIAVSNRGRGRPTQRHPAERAVARPSAADHLMPSLEHEQFVLLFRNRPALAPELLRDALGVKLPAYTEVRLDSAELTEVVPTEYRADLVVLLANGEPVLGIVVEVQLSRDIDKLFTWPVYVTGLRARIRCPCLVLVVCPSKAVARWAAKKIVVGGKSVFVPLVLGPGGVPVVTDPEAPVELLVLSAMAHGHDDDHETAATIAMAAAKATERLDGDLHELYSDLILAALGEAARKAFAMLPQGFQYRSEEKRTAFAGGEAKGRADDVLAVLEERGVTVTESHRERILACTDLDKLRGWVRRAARCESADELFEV